MSTNYHKFSGTVDVGTVDADTLTGTAVSSTDTSGSTVVKRSGGNFSAGTITANLSGHATTATDATNASNIYTSVSSTNEICYVAGFNTLGASPFPAKYSQYWYFRGPSLIGLSNATITVPSNIRTDSYIYRQSSSTQYYGFGNTYLFKVSNTIAADIDDDRVGIDDSTPIYTLDVNGSLRCFGFTNSSDERIKKNITDINDGDALNTIRLLQPKRYEYIDTKKANTEGQVWGFIAQELEDVMPYAVDTITDFIPNVFEWGNKTANKRVINVNTSNILPDQTLLQIKDGKNKKHTLTIESIIDSQNIRVSEDLSSIEGGQVDDNGDLVYSLNDEGRKVYASGNKIFVYGQKVNDFKTIKKNFIWTVATAALQEVDRQLQAEKTKVSTLQSQLTSVLARLDALESA